MITFQETYGDVLDPVRRRIRTPGSRLRRFGADYLAYALLDTIVDAYYPILERLGDRLEQLENEVIDRPVPELLRRLIRLKNRLVDFRRIVWAQREMVRALSYEDTPLIHEKVRVFLRDVYDHCVQTAEVVESYREMTTGLINTYLSSIGQRTNEVMKVLTKLKIYTEDEPILKLVSDMSRAPDQTGGIQINRLIIQPEHDDKKRIALNTVFNANLAVPIGFDVAVKLGAQTIPLGHMFALIEPGKSISGGRQLETRIDSLDPSIRKADIILTPNPRQIERYREVEEIWGEEVVIPAVPLDRFDLEEQE